MAGQQQRHHLVSDLPVGKVRVRRQQVQHRTWPTGAPPADEVVDDFFKLGLG